MLPNLTASVVKNLIPLRIATVRNHQGQSSRLFKDASDVEHGPQERFRPENLVAFRAPNKPRAEISKMLPPNPGAVNFMLAQPPHILWGEVALAGTPSVSVSDVRVEILDGPNAGKAAMSDARGRYRFDDLVASPSFGVRLSRVGHRTRIYGLTALRHNEQRNAQIEAE
jgi:hypothetical protein